MDAIGDCKALQKVARDTMRGIHKSVDPNIIIESDGTMQPRMNFNPGGLLYAHFTNNGQPKLKELQFNGNVSHGVQYQGELRDKINQHFFLDAFELPPITTPDGAKHHMSAPEFAGRQRQQLHFAGPLLARLRSAFPYPLVSPPSPLLPPRGIIPPPPPTLSRACRLETCNTRFSGPE